MISSIHPVWWLSRTASHLWLFSLFVSVVLFVLVSVLVFELVFVFDTVKL